MRKLALIAALASLAAVAQQQPTLVPLVKMAALAGNFGVAETQLAQYKSARGVTPEYIEAFSWLGRGQLAAHHYAEAEKNAGEVQTLCGTELAKRPLDAEPHLPIALGAAIEVEAQSLAGENKRDEAVLYLQSELKKWQATSIQFRLQKNLNLLTLEGKPVPVLEVSQDIGVGGLKPLPLAAHRGHPVLLFLWAHWCGDCKNEIPIMQRLKATYGPRGLVLIAPTQHYGYIAGGEDAAPSVETRYIASVFEKYYAGLSPVEVPVSETNFRKFGVSTTPTIVLIDGQGIVRLYNPGNLSYEKLAARIEPLLKPRS